VLSRFGIHVKGAEFDQLFETYDNDGNGSIDYKEFLGHFMGNDNDELAKACASIDLANLDMRDQKERDQDLMTNSLHVDPEVAKVLAASNVFGQNEHQDGVYDIRLLKPLTKALCANEIASGIVPIHKMFKILKWHGIDVQNLCINTDATVNVRPTTEGGRPMRSPPRVKQTSPSWRRVKGRGGGGGTVMRSSPRVSSARSDMSETKTIVGIRYRPILHNLFASAHSA
jgi:hypothetical protein